MNEDEKPSSPDTSSNESDVSNESEMEDNKECDDTKPEVKEEPTADNPSPAEEKEKKTNKKSKKVKREKSIKKKRAPYERRNIRKIRADDTVGEATREALEAEKARLARVERLHRQNVELNRQPPSADEDDKGDFQLDIDVPIEEPNEGPEESLAKRPRIEPPVTNFSDVIIVSEDDEDDLTVPRPPCKTEIKPLRIAPPQEDPDIIDLEDSDTESLNDAGSHVNDDNNKHDESGRVLINVGHPKDEKDLYAAPQIAAALKPHQIGGIRFLYDNVIESTTEISKRGFGCILAHAMGLGKTIQVITLTDIALRLAHFKTVLILVPINTIQNWISEFDRWLPSQTTFQPPPDSDDADVAGIPGAVVPRKFSLYAIIDSMKTFEARAQEVASWRSTGGVLLVGYEMFRILVQRQGSAARRPKPQRRRKKKGAEPEPDFIDIDKEEERAKMWDDMFTALVQPGPDIVIADEGHRIKNEKAEISQKVKNIETLRRVVLTGYPLQNNLEEYHCMVDFVRPNYLGSKMEFNNMFNRPITNGMCIDSTPEDRKLMYMRSHVLFGRLKGFVQRRSHKVLRDQLPEKTEYVLFLKMSAPQQNFYRLFMKTMGLSRIATWAQNNPLKAFAVSVKIMNHPDILYNACTNQEKESIDDDFDGNADSPCSNAPGRKSRPTARRNGSSTAANNTVSADFKNMFDENDGMWQNYSAGLLENGPKMVVFLDLLEAALAKGERVLAFTQSLSTLDIIETFLGQRQVLGRDEKWTRNTSYYRLDGSTPASERDRMIKAFNDPEGTASLFLLSTRAGCLGINLTAANRVIVFDASWNPCHDCQAVCRVFRYGQTRPCFVYRLIMDNTIERKIYERQVKKQSLSVRVVDETTPDQHFTRQQLEVLLAFEDRELNTCPPEQLRAVDWSDPILCDVLVKNSDSITQMPFTHESLLIDKREFHLTTKEKREALQQYENAKKEAALAHGIDMGMVSAARQSYANFYPRNGAYANPLLNPREFQPSPTVMQLHKVLENARKDHRRNQPSQKGKLAPLAPAPSGTAKPPYYGLPPQLAAKANLGMGDMGAVKSPNGRLSRRDSIYVKEITIPHDVTTPSSEGRPGIRIPRGTKVKLIQTEKGTYINHNNHMFALRSKLTPSGLAPDAIHRAGPMPGGQPSSDAQLTPQQQQQLRQQQLRQHQLRMQQKRQQPPQKQQPRQLEQPYREESGLPEQPHQNEHQTYEQEQQSSQQELQHYQHDQEQHMHQQLEQQHSEQREQHLQQQQFEQRPHHQPEQHLHQLLDQHSEQQQDQHLQQLLEQHPQHQHAYQQEQQKQLSFQQEQPEQHSYQQEQQEQHSYQQEQQEQHSYQQEQQEQHSYQQEPQEQHSYRQEQQQQEHHAYRQSHQQLEQHSYQQPHQLRPANHAPTVKPHSQLSEMLEADEPLPPFSTLQATVSQNDPLIPTSSNGNLGPPLAPSPVPFHPPPTSGFSAVPPPPPQAIPSAPPVSLGHQDPLAFDGQPMSDLGSDSGSMMSYESRGYGANPMFHPDAPPFSSPFMHNMFYQPQGPPLNNAWSSPLPSIQSMYPYQSMAPSGSYFNSSMMSGVPSHVAGCHGPEQTFPPSSTSGENVPFNAEPHLNDRPREQPVHM